MQSVIVHSPSAVGIILWWKSWSSPTMHVLPRCTIGIARISKLSSWLSCTHHGQSSLVSDVISWPCLSTCNVYRRASETDLPYIAFVGIHHNERLFQYSASHFLKQFTGAYLMQDQSAINMRRSSIVSHPASLTSSMSLKHGTIRWNVWISLHACHLVTDAWKELASDQPRKKRFCRRTVAVFVCFIDLVT